MSSSISFSQKHSSTITHKEELNIFFKTQKLAKQIPYFEQTNSISSSLSSKLVAKSAANILKNYFRDKNNSSNDEKGFIDSFEANTEMLRQKLDEEILSPIVQISSPKTCKEELLYNLYSLYETLLPNSCCSFNQSIQELVPIKTKINQEIKQTLSLSKLFPILAPQTNTKLMDLLDVGSFRTGFSIVILSQAEETAENSENNELKEIATNLVESFHDLVRLFKISANPLPEMLKEQLENFSKEWVQFETLLVEHKKKLGEKLKPLVENFDQHVDARLHALYQQTKI